MKTMNAKQYQHLCQRLAETAMNHEGNEDWKAAANAWISLADLREEDSDGVNRVRGKKCAARK